MLYQKFLKEKGKTKFAVLIDPDKPTDEELLKTAKLAKKSGVDYFFVGGSLLTNDNLDHCIKILKKETSIPVILFPGNTMQISNHADGILLLSLISGRNPELLIGRHVLVAPYLKYSPLEIISTGYILIESGKPTTVSYMSNSVPIPRDKKDIAACTAMAGEMLGMKLIFMDAGSGAKYPIPPETIKTVRQCVDIPIIIGGGIDNEEKAIEAAKAGADVIVIGNAIEKDPELIHKVSKALKTETCA
ncbi:MAG: geranylgeranylglyceryl/heptaprenylglyceryl phosphate synthase [Bacteroidales bacterium]